MNQHRVHPSASFNTAAHRRRVRAARRRVAVVRTRLTESHVRAHLESDPGRGGETGG